MLLHLLYAHQNEIHPRGIKNLLSYRNAAVKNNGKSTTNGANTPEDGWQVATGKCYTLFI